MSNVVRARLILDAGVTALASTRVYLVELEQDCTLPAITTEPTEVDPQNTLGAEASLSNSQWLIECWAKTYSAAEALADAVETAMATAGTDFTAVRTGRDVVFDNNAGIRGVSLDYSLWI